jgi:RNA polymerase sigma-70 factor (ECF subfamily)
MVTDRIHSGAPAVVLEMATSRASPARAAVDLAFEELYRGHRADVYRAALRELGNAHDAEDVTQAAFADAYRAVLRGTHPQSPRAWLLAISENVRRRRFRTAQRRPREQLVDDADFPPAAELPYEQSHALAEALATLPPEQRRVFVLREIAGLSYAEIADEAGSTVGSIQMLLFRARRSLREQLDPPTVAIRRPVFLPPVPSWLAGLFSRVELASLTPRAAGALGATVLTIAGASVAVPGPAGRHPRRGALGRSSESGCPRRACCGARRRKACASLGEADRRLGRASAVVAPTQRPARPTQPVATAPPASAPAAAPTSTPAPAAAPAQSPTVLVAEVATKPLELPLPQVRTTAGLRAAAPGPAPRPGSVAPPALPDAVTTATGAAGAAGASAPPVPVPAVPLPTLPQAP